MKQQDIHAVLKQAAELRASLCTAIDRSVLAHFHRLPLACRPADPIASVCEVENESDWSPAFSAAALEARSLASIRDALIVLEEQLECLQMLPDEQKADKKATLAELEESREILVRRLKQHRGREVAVIQEALSFVGVSSDEGHPILIRSYTLPSRLMNGDIRYKIGTGVDCSMDEMRSFSNRQSEKLDRPRKKLGGNTRPDGILGGLKSRLLGFINRRFIKVSAKCLFAVAGAAAVLTISNNVYANNTLGRKRTSSMGHLNRTGCPEKWTSVYSGKQRCVLTEPFQEEI